MPATPQRPATVTGFYQGLLNDASDPAGTTKIHFIYQTNTTSCYSEYSDPISRWLGAIKELAASYSRCPDVMDALDEAARHRQRFAWFAPRKISISPPVPPVRRYCKMFRGYLFPIGGKK